MASNTCEFKVGRLMEIRVAAGYRSVADVDAMIRMIGERVSGLAPEAKYVIAADWRNVTVMSPETATRVRAMLSKSNARAERSSILTLAVQSTANLQVQRLVREAENDNRRHFVSARGQHDWLSQVLTAEESVRLSAFLGLTEGG
jgi:3-oxoacyl-ACP reductase-like protein